MDVVKELFELRDLDGDSRTVLEGVDVDRRLGVSHDVLVNNERDNLLCVVHHGKGRGSTLDNTKVLLKELFWSKTKDVLVPQPELVLELLEVHSA